MISKTITKMTMVNKMMIIKSKIQKTMKIKGSKTNLRTKPANRPKSMSNEEGWSIAYKKRTLLKLIFY